jgi:peptidoglycan/LPS O-acetylase OafA/YrhL
VKDHFPPLDGLRGIAILLVLLHHFTIIDPTTPAATLAAQIALIGWCGVDLFFVLSGFLITGILIDSRGSERYFTSFYARRTLRIFPLYYLVAFLSLVVLPRFPAWFDLLAGAGAPSTQWPYWLYLTNFAIADRNQFLHGVLDITWSLAIEEQFYLLWAGVVWLCPPKALGWLCGAVVVGAPVARMMALTAGATDIGIYVLPWYRADALATGGLIAWLVHRGHLPALAPSAPRGAMLALAGIVIVAASDGETWWWGESMHRVGYSLIAMAGAGMLIAALTQPADHWWPRALSTPPLRAFGKYSYCLYLIHLPVMRTVRAFVLGPEAFTAFGSAWLGQITFYVLATAPAFAIAWLSWRFFEAPVLRLKRYFPY